MCFMRQTYMTSNRIVQSNHRIVVLLPHYGRTFMPLIHIDGQAIQANDGQTIIEAALQAGITIPHFCWHPALSVAGNCRMCLVNVGMQ